MRQVIPELFALQLISHPRFATCVAAFRSVSNVTHPRPAVFPRPAVLKSVRLTEYLTNDKTNGVLQNKPHPEFAAQRQKGFASHIKNTIPLRKRRRTFIIPTKAYTLLQPVTPRDLQSVIILLRSNLLLNSTCLPQSVPASIAEPRCPVPRLSAPAVGKRRTR